MAEEIVSPAPLPEASDGARVLIPPVPPANIKDATDEAITAAVELLKQGEVVAFPTETVYGLGADASNAEAVDRVFKLKGRPATHPLIVHIPSAAHMDRWGQNIPEIARALAKMFWPGPLTIVVQRGVGVLDGVTGGQDTVALRVPAHPVAMKLLEAFDGGIAAPSANKFGRVSPTLAKHVFADFQLHVPLILDGGATNVGIESTIVDCTSDPPRVLRPGGINIAQLEPLIGKSEGSASADAPRVSGSLPAHYAPRAVVKIVKRVELLEQLGQNKGRRIFVLGFEVSVPRLAQSHQRVVPVVAAAYQRTLYATLREFDAAGADLIFVEAPPRTIAWAAVWDRLER
ncbi:MAG: L-threonylcarbamoyladenylate synthase, partial [Burkholderiales bacterium]